MDKTLWYIGEGVIPQIEAAANKYVYGNMPSLPLFNQIMSDMADKAQSDTGNKLIDLAWVAWEGYKNKLFKLLGNP